MAISGPSPRSAIELLERKRHRSTRVGLVAGGLGAYWPQFPGFLAQLEGSAKYVSQRLKSLDCEVVDVGFISTPIDGSHAAEKLRVENCDLIVVFLTTYMTSSMVLPIAQRSSAPVLVIDLQPTEAMDHAAADTAMALAYEVHCPLPEVASVFRRSGIPFRSVSGYLKDEKAWERIGRWVRAARVRGVLRNARHGLMGHLYPGMLDVSTDLTLVSSQLGGHIEVLEFDDLRVRVEQVTDMEAAQRLALVREVFTFADSVDAEDLDWAVRVSVGLDRLVDDFGLDSVAYYHRGMNGEIHERLGAGMIVGSSLLTARGIPMAGEYELRTSLAMLIAEVIGAGGAFTELQSLDFRDGVVEMGHDGPGHLGISSERPLLRGLGVFHGKRGWGVSVEFDVAHGPVTTIGVGQEADGSLTLIASEGEVVGGPLMQIGNTTSRVDFGCDPGRWTELWCTSGVGHHWALSVGHRVDDYRATADLLRIPFVEVKV
jgi:L-arabinose isomerase